MKISRLEGFVVLLAGMLLAFGAGWFLRGNQRSQPIVVETQRQFVQEDAPLLLPEPTPTPIPGGGAQVNINTATEKQLQALPGIGDKRAEDIVAYREKNGPFRIVEDITRVKGIGEGTLAELLAYITVGE